MKGKSRFPVAAIVSLVILLVGGVVFALGQGPLRAVKAEEQGTTIGVQAAVGTGFTYQGQLKSGGSPVNGTVDFRFKLYDSASGTGQVGSTRDVSSVSVSDGMFTAQLDFGSGIFDGNARWLEIAVASPSGGSYTTLTPRQALSAAPYALYAGSTGNANTAATATYATTAGSASTANSANTAIAATNATTATYATTAGSASAASSANTAITATNATTATYATTAQGKYQRTVVVSPVGTTVENGTALLSALAGVTTASSTNPYMLKIEPGIYDLGGSALTMKQYVDIEGSGELATTIKSAGNASPSTGTVVGASNAELRYLTVKNTGGDTYALAIYNSSTSPMLTHITASTSGGTSFNYGIYNGPSSSPTMRGVTASSVSVARNYGIYNGPSSTPTLSDVTASGAGGTDYNYGVYNFSSSPKMSNVTASSVGGPISLNAGVYNESSSSPTMSNVTAAGSGGANSFGIYNDSSSSTLTNVTASATNGTNNWGVYNNHSSATIRNSNISASGGTNNYGVGNFALSGSYTLTVSNSQISGSTGTIQNYPQFTTHVGASELSGGAVAGSGTLICAGVYDENYVFSAGPACP